MCSTVETGLTQARDRIRELENALRELGEERVKEKFNWSIERARLEKRVEFWKKQYNTILQIALSKVSRVRQYQKLKAERGQLEVRVEELEQGWEEDHDRLVLLGRRDRELFLKANQAKREWRHFVCLLFAASLKGASAYYDGGEEKNPYDMFHGNYKEKYLACQWLDGWRRCKQEHELAIEKRALHMACMCVRFDEMSIENRIRFFKEEARREMEVEHDSSEAGVCPTCKGRCEVEWEELAPVTREMALDSGDPDREGDLYPIQCRDICPDCGGTGKGGP